MRLENSKEFKQLPKGVQNKMMFTYFKKLGLEVEPYSLEEWKSFSISHLLKHRTIGVKSAILIWNALHPDKTVPVISKLPKQLGTCRWCKRKHKPVKGQWFYCSDACKDMGNAFQLFHDMCTRHKKNPEVEIKAYWKRKNKQRG